MDKDSGPMTAEEAVAAFDAMPAGDAEGNHGEADSILLRVVPPEVAEAYHRAEWRDAGWWYA
jgi:hypothetical protein